MTPHNESPAKRVKRAALSPALFAQATGMTVKAVRNAIKTEEIRATRIGHLLHIPVTEIKRKFGEEAFNALDLDALLADAQADPSADADAA